MKACSRCGGYIEFPNYAEIDPGCVNCGSQFPELAQSNGVKKRHDGLRSTMRYGGKNVHMKELVGYITLKVHPSPGVQYPLLEIGCPHCGELAISSNAQSNPEANSSSQSRNGSTAKQQIFCTQGHSIRLKIDKEGRYTWD